MMFQHIILITLSLNYCFANNLLVEGSHTSIGSHGSIRRKDQQQRKLRIKQRQLAKPVCGDGNCNSKENCSNCPQDCGNCDTGPPPTPIPAPPTDTPVPPPTDPPVLPPTAPPTEPPTITPPTEPPVAAPVPVPPTPNVACYCCLGSPGFGDYFQIEGGGYLATGQYGEGTTAADLTCTAAYTSTSSNLLQLTQNLCNVEVLVVGGGGAGGQGSSFGGGGGGAGEVIVDSTVGTLSAGTYTVEVGAGGSAGGNGGVSKLVGLNGIPLSLQANGGGHGATVTAAPGNGGSGGGSYGNSLPIGLSVKLSPGIGQGSNGAEGGGAGGGGGGALLEGSNAYGSGDCFEDYGGDGGEGIDVSTTFGYEFGDYGRFGGGGGGGQSGDITSCSENTGGAADSGGGAGGGSVADPFLNNGGSGTPTSGGGGGGGSGSGFGLLPAGGSGGSGIVMIRFQDCP
mmetsp:Transcript_17330/g.25605  ORF Transcript_17330/g.25605 Transcript_17330/m.25605 type:complete len:453 (+) Transcript_17330:212-1570(+)|eukprot:CAMPEP_0194199216 /NCGR_PEP_ID=MMETSP0156-20130528/309_1 /TAXON_ID=33649 /ORGANISM="Thalassionema nitzschioides, Strain L26-B" /LENGTH=452 /DNA_ID=CAMNT_0038924075 /DNA_START=163 /DNA_END=1521 /DNA_ORIENTATION=+